MGTGKKFNLISFVTEDVSKKEYEVYLQMGNTYDTNRMVKDI